MEAFFAESCVCCASPTPPLPVTPLLPNFGPPGTVALHPTPPAYPPPTRMLPSEIRHINDTTASERFREKRPGQPPQRSVSRWVPPTAKAKALSLVHKDSKRWQTVGAKRRKTIETIICEAVVRSLERENSVLEQERQEIATIEEPCWQRGRVGFYTLALASAEEQRGEAHDQRRKKPVASHRRRPSYPRRALTCRGSCSRRKMKWSGESAAPE